MPYAEVSVNSPIAQRRAFSYNLPEGLSINVGQAVWVPFGNKTFQGIVLELTALPAVEETRDIAGVIESIPLLSPAQVTLGRWISDYYLAPLFESIALMLPPGFERRVITFINRSETTPETPAFLNPEQREVLNFITQKDKVGLRELEKTFGRQRIQRILPVLSHHQLISKSYRLENVKVKPKIEPFISLKVSVEKANEALAALKPRAVNQINLLKYLMENPHSSVLFEVRQKTGCSSQSINALIEKGLIEIKKARLDREPLSTRNINLSFPLTLTPSQESVFQALCASLRKESDTRSKPDVFLLHGVTGSGKTEIYIQLLEQVVKQGKRGIVLVPEIAMTPQIIERFVSRFPGKVAILHSELTLGEQFDEWWRIRNGEFDVVIGPRSAIFAPQPDLGLIILDEEHEWTYKQQDFVPRYHAREVALKLAGLTGALVVLGSATPDVESYFQAVNRRYTLAQLPERATRGEGSPLPQVEIVDLRAELKSGNLSLFSHSLSTAIEAALKNREQVLLFLNRRGAASFVECRNCGWVICCKRCEVPLSYHFNAELLVCHQCNYHIKVPQVCPRCRSRRIKYLGVGTEKLEQETARIFPQARLLRWDSDVIHGHGHAHQEIFQKFRSGGADILIGTQMVAKGLDLPGVTLVGVISADIALNLPDFRAGERAFQLLSQVAGRAGRGSAPGQVIIQTYSPEHYAIQSAARHDYVSFYKKELAYRQELHNPPFSRLARLTYTHADDAQCQKEAERLKEWLLNERARQGLTDINLIGPAPAFIHRLRGRFRWQIILRATNPSNFLAGITFPRSWTIDIDPIGLN